MTDSPPPSWLDRGLALLDPHGSVLEINEALRLWLGPSLTEIPPLPFWKCLFHRQPAWETPIRESLSRPTVLQEIDLSTEIEGRHHRFRLELTRTPPPAPGFTTVRLSSVVPSIGELAESGWSDHLRNPSAQWQMFGRLLRAESQLDKLMNRWPGVIFSQRPDMSFHLISAQVEALTGVPAPEFQNSPERFWQVVHEADIKVVEQQLRWVQQSGKPGSLTYRIRHTQTGRVCHILENREAIRSEGGLLLGYEGVWLDVTRQAIAERRLTSAAGKETLAVLTTGLAHDFSNIMAGIHALGEAFQAQLPPDDPFQENVQLIQESARQASQLIQRILNLHCGKSGELAYHNLNELVRDLLELIRKIIPRRIRIETDLVAESLPVYLDAVEFRQVLINLIINAVDAMPDSGTLRIVTRLADPSPTPANIHGTLPAQPCINLALHDTGSGIPARHLSRIFDPFFTTKATNKGSGLGLYNARVFVENHHGAISVDSAEKVGTTFQLWLPQADFSEADRLPLPATLQRRTLLLAGPPGVLIGDTARWLRENGYYVAPATSDESALEHLRSPDYSFSAAVLLACQGLSPNDAILREIKHLKIPIRTILCILGCSEDDIDAGLLSQVDLVIPHDMPRPDALARIRILVDGNPVNP